MSAEPSTNPETPVNASESGKAHVLGAAVVQSAPPKRKPGRPPGIKTPLASKRTYDPDQLAENLVTGVLSGRVGIKRSPSLGMVTADDKRTLARITGEPVEVFNERFAQKLRVISDKAVDRIEQKLDNDEFKTGELAFVMTSATDKRLAIDGSRALQTASVNIQVNNYGSSPKEALLADLDGLGNIKQVSPLPSQAVG